MGSTRIRISGTCARSSSDTPARTSPGVDPKTGSLPQNEIARAQSQSQGPIRERRASTRANHRNKTLRTILVEGGLIICR